jgi:predicted peroxiredoxin
MSGMPQINLIVATADGRRFYAALEAAIAWAALGRSVRLFLQGEAVALLREPVGHAGDEARRAAGQPDLAWMLNEAMDMDVALFACQTGMTLANLSASDFHAAIRPIGLIGFLADCDPTGSTVSF